MVLDRYRDKPNYRCGRQQREGREVCGQPTIVAWYVRELVFEWMCQNVLTFERMVQAREAINHQLSGNQGELLSRKKFLENDKSRIERGVRGLLDTVEITGLTDELQKRLRERSIEVRQIESELTQIGDMLKRRRVEVSDEALRYLAENLQEQLLKGDPEQVRRVVRQTLVRVELKNQRLGLHYVTPLAVPESIACINSVPPWEFESQSWP